MQSNSPVFFVPNLENDIIYFPRKGNGAHMIDFSQIPYIPLLLEHAEDDHEFVSLTRDLCFFPALRLCSSWRMQKRVLATKKWHKAKMTRREGNMQGIDDLDR